MKKFNQCKKPSPVNEETPFFGGQPESEYFFHSATPAIQASPLSDNVKNTWNASKNKGSVFDILRANGPSQDQDLRQYIDSIFPNTTDDWWLADTILQYGPEPLWPFDKLVERNKRSRDNKWGPEPGNIGATMDKAGKIQAYYFPGTSDRRAMIIGGVHGSEKAGVETVNILLDMMRSPQAQMPFFSVIIVPSLFPDNLALGRRITPGQADPNRQLPALGKDATTDPKQNNCKVDSEGRCMEEGNAILTDLVDRFKPERVASVHGHSNLNPAEMATKGGPSITTDPRSGKEAEDDALTLEMAKKASSMGVRVPGNRLGQPGQSTRYPNSTAPRASKGVSFGEWGSSQTPTRPAMNVITVETFGNSTSQSIKDPKEQKKRKVELESLATVLHDIFLADPATAVPAQAPPTQTQAPVTK